MTKAMLGLRLAPHQSVTDLSTLPADDFHGGKDKALEKTEQLRRHLVDWQERLYAEGRRKLLVVLQAMDTGGKDGLISKVFSGVNPLGVRVARFQAPSEAEMARDYLWRVHEVVPAKGEIGIFNRSHYEDVLAVRVNKLVPKTVWSRRYEHIRAFERMLSDEGTHILKFFLHIDRDEQRKRLQARLDDPEKHWKFDLSDIRQRGFWDEYMQAYTQAIHETDCEHAPWYVIPADRKWYRDYVAMSIIVQTLEQMDPRFPKTDLDPASIVIDP